MTLSNRFSYTHNLRRTLISGCYIFAMMKLAIISDIHSNLEALEAAFAEIDGRGVAAVYCLGDIVGYGPDPVACVDLVRARCTGAVRGNHDEAVALQRGLDRLPRDAQVAALHNREQLSPGQLHYLSELPYMGMGYDCTFVHATPKRPETWQRLNSFTVVQEQFAHFSTAVCFVGHTHLPGVMGEKIGVLRVRPGNRYLINVGSVGQPRDQNPRLCVAFFDTETFDYELVRVPYDVERTAAKIAAAGLPLSLSQRLKVGQ